MKKKVALIVGGYSKENVISIKSGNVVEKHIDKELYDTYKICIDKDGWFYLAPDGSKVEIDKNDFSLTIQNTKLKFDIALIIIHGSPGENGLLQSYFDLLQIPYTTCSATVSALTFNKAYCNAVLAQRGIQTSASIQLFQTQTYSLETIAQTIGFPCFVKPNAGGSSIGMSKVQKIEELQAAIDSAFAEDREVLIERFVKGREFSCGVFKVKGEIIVFPITEIISQKDFFDYEAKYFGFSNEVTPADIPASIAKKISETTKHVYELLDCKGIVRCDYILEENSNKLYFLEVNTVPGQSEQSIVPQQIRHMGWTEKQLYTTLIEECLR